MEKYLESLQKALSHLRIADHILYVTYPIIKDKKLLLKSLDSIYESLVSLINAVLQYDYLWKRVQLYRDPRENFETFKKKCAKRYNISESEIDQLLSFLELIESHKKSPMEFMRSERVIILSDNLKTTALDIEKVKLYLNFARGLLSKVQSVLIKNHF